MAKCNLSAGDIHTAEGKKHEKRHLTHFCTYPYFLCLAIQIPQVHNTTHQRRNCLSLSISNQTLLSLWALKLKFKWSCECKAANCFIFNGHGPRATITSATFCWLVCAAERSKSISTLIFIFSFFLGLFLCDLIWWLCIECWLVTFLCCI